MKRYAIIAGTPYTLLSAINLVVNVIPRGCETDLFVRSISSMDEYIEKLKKAKIFTNVYRFKLRDKEKSIGYYIYDLKQAAFPKSYLKEILDESIQLDRKNYDYITVSSGFDVEMALIRTFPNAKQIAIDDGLGSYVGDIVHDHKLSWLWEIFGRNNDKIHPEVLYVNNVNACRSTMCKDIRSIRGDRDKQLEIDSIMGIVFGNAIKGLYSKARFVYLTQPLLELGFKENILDNVIYDLRHTFGQDLIVRIHPRDQKRYSEFRVDTYNQLWEIICKEEINDSKCLIGICSTAHIMPKILFDAEPAIVFLYRLLEWEPDNEALMRFKNVERMITDMYRDKSKIIVPLNFSEFKKRIEELASNE